MGDGLTLGLAIRDEQLHGVWMEGEERLHSDAVPLGYRTIAEALKELLTKWKEIPARVGMAVPFQRLLMRSIEIPSAPDLPIGPFAEQFALSELPYPLEEAVMDYCIQAGETSRRILVVVGQKKEFEPYRAALETIHGPQCSAVPITLALYKASDVPAAVPNFLLVYFWKTSMEIVWCSNGEPRYLRHVPMQQERVLNGVTSKNPDLLTRLSTELRLSGEFIRKQTGVEIRTLMARLVSTDRRFDGLPALLQPEVPFTLDGRVLEGSEGSVLAVGVCGILRTGSPDLNLLQPKKSRTTTQTVPADQKQKLLIAAMAGVLVILILGIVKTLVSYTWAKNAESARVAQSPADETGLPPDAAVQLASFLAAPDAIDAFGRLASAVPPEAQLQDVAIEASEISLRGTAPRAMAVYEGLNSHGFKDVRFLQDVVGAEEGGQELFALSATNPFAPSGEVQ